MLLYISAYKHKRGFRQPNKRWCSNDTEQLPVRLNKTRTNHRTYVVNRTSLHFPRWAGIQTRCLTTGYKGDHRYSRRQPPVQMDPAWRLPLKPTSTDPSGRKAAQSSNPLAFLAFHCYLESVLGRPAKKEDTLDRINNSGHYQRGNLRFATPTLQRQNQTRARTHNGLGY
jgi:hypothetical protein